MDIDPKTQGVVIALILVTFVFAVGYWGVFLRYDAAMDQGPTSINKISSALARNVMGLFLYFKKANSHGLFRKMVWFFGWPWRWFTGIYFPCGAIRDHCRDSGGIS